MSVYVAIRTIRDEDRIRTLWYSSLYHVSLSNVDADTDNKLRSLYLILLIHKQHTLLRGRRRRCSSAFIPHSVIINMHLYRKVVECQK